LRYGRKVYSQNDEDGIIAEIFRRIGTGSRRFIEIGAADGLENNTVWLLLQGWSGTWLEASPALAEGIARKFHPLVERKRLTVEYNGKFPPPHEFVMKYNSDKDHSWDLTDYFGASLTSWNKLLCQKGYSLVACNITGVNAFFVRNDLIAGKFCEPLTPDNHYEPARYWLTSGFVSGHPPNFGEGHGPISMPID
jgi:hypothetical protein